MAASQYIMTPQRFQWMDFLSPMESNEMTFFSQKPKAIGISYDVLFWPFQYPVWSFVLVSLLLTWVLLTRAASKQSNQYFDNFTLTIATVVGQSLTNRSLLGTRESSAALGLYLSVWLLTSTLLFFAYGSNLLVVLTTLRWGC